MHYRLLLAGILAWVTLPDSPLYADDTDESSIAAKQAVAGPSERRQTPLVKAVQRVKASVVNIHTEKTTVERNALFPAGKSRKINGMGTGIVIDASGYLVTNHHVVHEVDSLRCVLHDGSIYTGRVVVMDKTHDLAIVKINPTRPLQVMPTGTSSDLMLGETVIAIGNAYGYEHTVTCGIVSHLSRDVEVNEFQSYENLIQTDASINPGNSGGPLLNLDGEVIGINVAIRAGAQRIGFAIPMDDARQHIARMFNLRRLIGRSHGFVTRDSKRGAKRDLVVTAVSQGTPASRCGVRSGDIIRRVDRLAVTDRVDLERALFSTHNRGPVEIVVERKGREETLTFSLNNTKTAANLVSRRDPEPTEPKQKITTTIIRGNSVTAKVSATTPEEKPWTMIGCRLTPIKLDPKTGDGTRYRGGMRVTDVRPDSPAAENGITKGDVLVGLHEWETISPENVTFVLDHPKLSSFAPLKFYILRGKETLYGHMQLAVGQ